MSTISQLHTAERLRATTAAAALRSNAANAAANRPAAARQPDAVSLSPAARSLAAAHKSADGAPDVREDRISAIKAALANGTYSVDSRRLANSLVAWSDGR